VRRDRTAAGPGGEKKVKHCLAVDLGASSGRCIVGWREGGTIRTREVHRFPNRMERNGSILYWDTDRLLWAIREGIRRAKTCFGTVDSLAIDSWGVDYVLIRGEEEVRPVYAYRDGRTADVIREVHDRIPFSELYHRTGCQFQAFNTIYQLTADRLSGRLQGTTDFLMIPEYLSWKLCGVKAKEYTNATTTGMVSVSSGEFDQDIVSALGLPSDLFPPLCQPGTPLGEFEGVPVLLCASHDTASAVEGMPGDPAAPYISSGTWSLLGLRTAAALTDERSRVGNWSNEGGVGYYRYQKNIMGMWLLDGLRRDLCPNTAWDQLLKSAEESPYDGLVDPQDPRFLAPENMAEAFDAALGNSLSGPEDYIRCACRSLASAYADSIKELERNTGRRFRSLTVVGGGAKNGYLNRLTEEQSGLKVDAFPVEATALGNLKIQLEAEL